MTNFTRGHTNICTVANTVPNYAYVSDTVRALRVLPVGNFMSFPSEIMRTGTNV